MWTGLFRADILCKDINTQQWVLIENQIEKTTHPTWVNYSPMQLA